MTTRKRLDRSEKVKHSVISEKSVLLADTQRIKSEKALEKSETRFQSIYEESPIGIEIYDAAGQLVEINPACLDLFGVSDLSDVVGFKIFDDPNISEKEKDKLRKGETVRFETPFDFEKVKEANLYKTSKSGTIYLDILITPLGPKEGRPSTGYLVHIQDITERRKAQEELQTAYDEMESRVQERTSELVSSNQELQSEVSERKRMVEIRRESEERYRMLLHSIPQKVFYKDRNSVYAAVNSSYASDFNLSPDDFIGKTDFDFYPHDLAEKYRNDDRRVMYSGITEELDESYMSEGVMKTVHTLKTPVRDEKGQVVGILGIFWDITERKRAEEERESLLKEIQQLARDARRRANELEITIGSIVDAVFVCDNEGRIVDVNKAGLLLLGMSEKPAALLPLVDRLRQLNLRHPNGKPITAEELAIMRALNGQVVPSFEEIATSPRTHRDIHLLTSAAPIQDQEGNILGAVEVISDISSMRELDKLKDEFIIVAAHELKTPVAIMKGYAQALLRSTAERSPQDRKMLDAINRGADRIDNIVKDLLDISRLYLGRLELQMERVDLSEITDEVVNRMASKTTKHHICLKNQEPAIIKGDRDRLEQVLTNLLDNAIRYSPGGGEIEVTVSMQNHEALVSVRDQGVGIPLEKQGRLFERFYRAHTNTAYDYGGMGVGLYLAREIVLRHGGRMWFESEEGKGSTFYFSIPLQGDHGTK